MSVRHLALNRIAGALCAAVLIGPALAAPAEAAPPQNDRASRATLIASVPAVHVADTREATRDAVRRPCVEGHSVWYRFTPTMSGRQRISTIGSSYDTLLAVYSGARSPRTRLSCNDDAAGLQSAVRPDLVAGQQYWIAVSSCCGTRGGSMVLRLPQGDTPPSVEMEIEEVTAGAVSGRLRVHGFTTCATPSVVEMVVTASQRVDSGVARGTEFGFLSFCSTDPTDWVVRIDTETGWAFAPGLVALDVFAVGDDGFSRFPLSFETNAEAHELATGRVAP